MVDQPILTAHTLPDDAVAGGFAREPNGNIWVTDKRFFSQGNRGLQGTVYRLDSAGNVLTTLKLPASLQAAPYPAEIALEMDNSGTTVVNVWVTDLQDETVYFFPPGTTATNDVKVVTLPQGCQSRGIIFDSNRRRMWVADENSNSLQAITLTGTVDTQLSFYLNRTVQTQPTNFPGPTHLVLDIFNRIWFTQAGQSKVGYYDPAQKTATFFSAGTSPSGPMSDSSLYFHDLKFGADGKKLWITAYLGNSLWSIEDVTNPKAELKKEVSFPEDASQPKGLFVDSAGFIWVTLSNAKSVFLLTPEGAPVYAIADLPPTTQNTDNILYTGPTEPSRASAQPNTDNILYTGPTDDMIFFSDDMNRVISFKPVDPINASSSITVTAVPPRASAQPNNFFDDITITLTDTATGNPIPDSNVMLMISNPNIAIFDNPPGTNTFGITIIRTNTNGQSVIRILKTSANAQNGESFTLSGRLLRGAMSNPFFTGIVGTPVAGITAVNGNSVSTRINKIFPEPLKAQLSGPGPFDPGNIVFKIDDTSPASFVAGSTDTNDKTITNPINVNNGLATATIYALDTPGAVTITAFPESSPSMTASFSWAVNPVPDNLSWITGNISAFTGQPISKSITAALMSGGTPVPGETLTISVVSPTPIIGFFHKNSNPTEKTSIIKAVTDQSGQVQIGKDPKLTYYLQVDSSTSCTICAILNDGDDTSPPLSDTFSVSTIILTKQ
ncbi:MAG: hypothetical protein PW790_10995 [Parvibaculaceae bacterium]|nr:hypothetical protein [Parvibaculaceae bacterium]